MANTRKSPSTEADALFERFCREAGPLLTADSRVVVAYSGGLDSTVLLDLFSRLHSLQPFSLSAFHLHHGLSPNADAWQAHCAAVCDRLGMPLLSERADLSLTIGEGVEARARAARYAAFDRRAADWVALAHHRDDQAETMLYRLVRGAGVHGAAGMPRRRPLPSGGRVWRPLLSETRRALLAYAQVRGLAWVEDESNHGEDYDRNYLRNRVMPALVSRFPSAQRALARAADLFGEAATLADALAEMDAGGVAPRLPLDRLAGLDEIRQRNLLRWFLARHGVLLERTHIELVRQQFLSAADDANPLLRVGSQEVRRYRGALWLASHTTPPRTCSVLAGEAVSPPDWPGRLDWQLRPGGVPLSSALCLALRVRQGGEAIRVRQGGPRRSVKHLMQEAGIPPWLRARWPLLWYGDQLVGVAGIAVDVAFQAKCDTLSIVPVWQPRDWPDAPVWFTEGLAPEGSA